MVFAARGTEPTLEDLVITDFSDIVLDGIAIGQVVDMYNYWQRLKAQKGVEAEMFKRTE